MKQFVYHFLLGLVASLMIQSGSSAEEQGSRLHSVKSTGQKFYVILGAIEKPGVYEINGKTPRVSELITRSGQTVSNSSSIHIVRNGRPGLTINLTPQNDLLLLDGDIVYVPGAIPKKNKTYITLLNLIDRPVVLPMNNRTANLDWLLKSLGQSPESVQVVHANTSRRNSFESNSSLSSGTVLVFHSRLVNKDSIPTLTGYIPDQSVKTDTKQFAENSHIEKTQTENKKSPVLPVLPVPIQDPEVGIVNSEGKIGFPPAHADYENDIIQMNEDDGLKASSKIIKNKIFPTLTDPTAKKRTHRQKLAEESTLVPPPPVENIVKIETSQHIANKNQHAKSDSFKVSTTLIVSVMIAAILITSALLGSMATSQPSSSATQKTKVMTNTVNKKTISSSPPISRPNYLKRRKHNFDLEALIQDELVITEKKPSFSNMENIYGTPAGPRMIRVEQKQGLKAPHYVREVRNPQSERKEPAFAVAEGSQSAVQDKIREQIETRVKQETQVTDEKPSEAGSENSSQPVKKKRVKLKKPSLELSIEQKLGMLDQVLSSVKKPEENS